MKRYYIYQDSKGDYFIAKSKNRKHIGDLIGWVKGTITDKEISTGWSKGDVVSLINDERIEIDSYKFYELQVFKVDAVDEEFFVIAKNVNVAVDMVLNEDGVKMIENVKIVSAKELTYEQMKEILIPANEEMETDDTNLFDVFLNYNGRGEIICSTLWID
jgi:hypothetical protein